MTFRRLGFELTNRCNLDCVHCLRGTEAPRRDLSFDLIRRTLEQGRRLGLDQIAFTGGEPLLHPRFDEIIRLTAELGYPFSLVTNGVLLPRRLALFAEPAVKAKLKRIALSVDGADAATHDAVRGAGSFKQVMSAIAACRARELPVRMKLTVTKKNLDQVEKLALLAAHLGMQGLEVSHLHPTPDNLAAGLMLDPADWRRVEARVERLSRELKVLVSMCAGAYDPCAFALCAALDMTELYVDVRGRLCLCCMLPGVRGSDPAAESDVAADLEAVDLFEAHARLVDLIAAYHRRRLGRWESAETDGLGRFPCLACAREFGKLDWLQRHPESPWSALLAGRKGER